MASLLPNFMRNGEFRPETLTSRPSLGQGSARAPKACLVLAMAGRPSDEVLEPTGEQWKLGFEGPRRCLSTSGAESVDDRGFLDLQEVEKVLSDVKANDVGITSHGFVW
ncbi:hypothetical protein CDL15_Pgr007055 [Punica granatum]|uniref:Uncharacterized protein n=1 Tax=Punica granatum TaxID=22663 RepID=A0A218X7S6_PUNGR|nr:hypothetical protein CDL15_Pgr007055 [Punica granatum]